MKIIELEELLYKAVGKYVPSEDATHYAKENIEILLRKSNERDAGWLEQLIHDIEQYEKFKENEFEIISEKEGIKLIDCHNLPASFKLKEFQDDLELRAMKLGIAATGLIHLGGDDALSLWTSDLAKRGLIALCLVNGGHSRVVPFGGIRPMLGVNPMSYAIPTLDNPVIGDFATSQLANYRVKAGIKNKQNPEFDAVVDEKGNPTNDLEKGFTGEEGRYLPMGANYKGYEIVFLLEVLTGALVRSKMGDLKKSKHYDSTECGQLIIAIDIGSFTDLEAFKESVSTMCDNIRKQEHASFVDSVTVPGDRGYERMNELLTNGEIEISEENIERLRKLSN